MIITTQYEKDLIFQIEEFKTRYTNILREVVSLLLNKKGFHDRVLCEKLGRLNYYMKLLRLRDDKGFLSVCVQGSWKDLHSKIACPTTGSIQIPELITILKDYEQFISLSISVFKMKYSFYDELEKSIDRKNIYSMEEDLKAMISDYQKHYKKES